MEIERICVDGVVQINSGTDKQWYIQSVEHINSVIFNQWNI